MLTTLICWPRVSRKLSGTPVTRAVSTWFNEDRELRRTASASCGTARPSRASVVPLVWSCGAAVVLLATGALARVRVIIVILSKDRSNHRTLS